MSDLALRNRVDRVVLVWRGTPYVAGQRTPGPHGGVDCVRFVCSIWDALGHRQATQFTELPHDTAFHDKEAAIKAMHEIAKLFPCDLIQDWEKGGFMPGDILLVGPKNGAPGHAMIVGGTPCHYWHVVQGIGVVRTGVSYFKQFPVRYVVRSRERESWGITGRDD